MTKYEYIHNKNHEKKVISKGMDVYSTPVERIILIVFINIILLCFPFLVIFTQWYYWILAIIILIVLFIWTEYNIFYNLENLEYFFYYLFSKNTSYKELIICLKQYENQINIEKKLGRKLRKSYLNCKKVYFEGKSSGYFTNSIICCNGKKEKVDFSIFKSKKETIEFIKKYIE